MSAFDNDEDHSELDPSEEFVTSMVFFITQLKTCPQVLNKFPFPSIKNKKEIGLKKHNEQLPKTFWKTNFYQKNSK